VTTVPLLVREQTKTYPFLAKDFAPNGVLAGKEVYAFSPSTITVVAGDTLSLTLLNPEDDDHSFVMSDFFVKLPPQGKVDTTYVARTPGVYDFSCSVPAHVPMMRGQLVVLAPDAVSREERPDAR
jgi:plastocyanin